jgi:glycosyltransferase involved in cell wall biosynthesis
MKVLLVGNYEFDGSMSMKLWADLLARELRQAGIDTQLIAPRSVFGKLRPSVHGIGKWLGYIDRFVLFPFWLRAAAARVDIVHLCDHGGAMYAPMLRTTPVVVTCHDMIAVRAARGELPEMHSSLFGKLLQRWICHGLRRATRVVCVSRATFNDARAILGDDANLCVVLNALNHPFQPLASSDMDLRPEKLGGIPGHFILHVGSNLPYKNREGVLRVFAQASRDTDLQLVIAGEPLNRSLWRLARELKIEDRIVQYEKPEFTAIEALYNRAACLLFPSHYEGFGWPPTEAQACGCPVVASDIPPFAETLGSSAILKPVQDEAGMADAVRTLASDEEVRKQLRQRGFENVRTRFQTARLIGEYALLYREIARTREIHMPGMTQL